MYSINKNLTYEYEINKSKFITKLYYINDDFEVNDILKKIKSQYKDATHYCYAYIVNNKNKAYDDGEPSGTAGIPILNVLKKNNLNNVLCIVIRYFGGIKLGAGGLVRAYTNSVSESLINNIIEYQEGYHVKIIFDYNETNKINFILKNQEIIYKEFNDNIIYEFLVNKKDYQEIKKELTNSSIIKECYIKVKEKP